MKGRMKGYKDIRKGCKNIRMQRCKKIGYKDERKGCKNDRIQEYKDDTIQRYKDTRMIEY